MKTWIIFPIVCLVGCSTPMPPAVGFRPMPQTAAGPEPEIRYPETLKAYHVGRYVEPHNELLLHEQHAVYRIEAMPAWNLHPPAKIGSVTYLGSPTNATYSPAPATDEIVAELNHQKQITQAVKVEAGKLTGSLGQFAQAFAELRGLTQQGRQVQEQLAAALKRIESLETELKILEETRTPADLQREPTKDNNP